MSRSTKIKFDGLTEVEMYRYIIKEANDWLVAGEGIDLCYHMDSEPRDKQLVRQILDNIYMEAKPR